MSRVAASISGTIFYDGNVLYKTRGVRALLVSIQKKELSLLGFIGVDTDPRTKEQIAGVFDGCEAVREKYHLVA